MSENTQQTPGTAVEGTQQAAAEPAQQVEVKAIPAGQETQQAAESQKGNADESKKQIAELQKIVEGYKKAEADAKEAKLKEEGKLNELLAEKQKQIEEMQKQIIDKTKADNIRKLLKENNVPENIIGSKFPTDIIGGDYFDEGHNVKKDAFKKITADYPFVVSATEPNANISPIPPVGPGMEMNQFINQKISEYSNDPVWKQRITGEMDIPKMWA